MPVYSATELLEKSIITYRGEPVGTAAACDPKPAAPNYEECFVRDFVPSAMVFLMRGEYAIVRNFLNTVMSLRGQQSVMPGHQRAIGLMPASFRVVSENGEERLQADFGEMAIGRVAPVDSAMWWMFLLRAYVRISGDTAFARERTIQECMRQTLELYLKESFEAAPTMLVPDGSFMIDRRMGVYGHPLEIQALYFGMLNTALELLEECEEHAAIRRTIAIRSSALRSYVRIYYWMGRDRLNEIHRYHSEEFGPDARNVLNVYPESIPDWTDGWLKPGTGYLVGNVGPSRVDFRFFAMGNLLAILMGLASEDEAQAIMRLYHHRWDQLVGEMPLKILYPAVEDKEWQFMTGSDPKNAPWSYHNGGNWPVLLWPFIGAARRTGRMDLAEHAFFDMGKRLTRDHWPEYYDGRLGSLIGRRANFNQVWSAAAYLISRELMENPAAGELFDRMCHEQQP
ncbi:MAG: glycoside hydrolase 100 family protein [Gammaproteobacteria bacterium]|nr:glycoside hydrolase 100 family protein [Gammaproteobacteria bacterium]MCW8993187.1 glycoside hydrolase 100 family protein [Gammaproteobacteria bacterium]